MSETPNSKRGIARWLSLIPISSGRVHNIYKRLSTERVVRFGCDSLYWSRYNNNIIRFDLRPRSTEEPSRVFAKTRCVIRKRALHKTLSSTSVNSRFRPRGHPSRDERTRAARARAPHSYTQTVLYGDPFPRSRTRGPIIVIDCRRERKKTPRWHANRTRLTAVALKDAIDNNTTET